MSNEVSASAQELSQSPNTQGHTEPPLAPVFDLFEERLWRGGAISLEQILLLRPIEPLTAVEPLRWFLPDKQTKEGGGGDVIKSDRGLYMVVPRKWTKRELRLAQRFPGFQSNYHYREARKYNDATGEPLRGWVRELLTTAGMHHSRAVEAYDKGWAKYYGKGVHYTNLPFEEWLPGYMEPGTWFSRAGSRWDIADQVVRVACGLTRFPPTRRKAR